MFFFKQKTADELRISDWSSYVCSSDLRWKSGAGGNGRAGGRPGFGRAQRRAGSAFGACWGSLIMGNAKRLALLGGTAVSDRPFRFNNAVGAEDRKSTRLNSSH